ncbi:hypothetical protein SPW_5578 [Streptomyces sp. W007]|uniref:DUF4913 domain-containing protein n=1 Tax=Streptomyces sp. W007 TaxID=1055352 RepID=UPI000241A49F|nr:DUF4913 domain-containing protein [Streptomyces sp. W007]EHM26039.1 hypothetical protein SPW_5578 [Streptomyces sp. W007]
MPDSPTSPPPAPASLAEDIEDLKAQFRALTTQLNQLTSASTQEPADPAAPDETQGGTGDGEGSEDEAGDEPEWVFPPFILLLESPEYEDELRALTQWVEGVLVPGYLAEPAADARWCHLWTEHPVAVARLHALWLAWQELTDPATCGHTGPSVWHRDHYDPCIRELRTPGGPFNGCTKGEHRTDHRQPSLVPSAWSHA